MKINKLKDLYRAGALLLLNTIIVFILINVIIGIAFFVKDQVKDKKDSAGLKSGRLFDDDGRPLNNSKRHRYQLAWFDYSAYEQIVNEEYAGTVLDDFFALRETGLIYQPWVQFSEPPYNSQLVNVDVDSNGFTYRRTVNPENKNVPDIRIFTFGGSTTFGYNVSDEHTWPSYLSKELNDQANAAGIQNNIEVINYGRGFYNPSQELVLLLDLLKSNHHPDFVIFLDGVNWGPKRDVPHFTKDLRGKLHKFHITSDRLSTFLSGLNWIPMIRFANALKFKLHKKKMQDEQIEGLNENTRNYVKQMINRFQTNRKIISQVCKFYGINVLFFQQPDAIYNYPENLYRRQLPQSFLKSRNQRKQFYNQMNTMEGVIDLTGLFELWGSERKAIVDDVHYSPSFNHYLAQQISTYIHLDSLKAGYSNSMDRGITGVNRILVTASP